MKCLCQLKTLLNIFILLILLTLQITAYKEPLSEYDHHDLPPTPPFTDITIPGTYWCGERNISRNYHDLGPEYGADKCCRDHAYCKDILDPYTTFHAVNNTDWVPVLGCRCETVFIQCLQAVNTVLSNTLGLFYRRSRKFCVAKIQPIVSCSEYQKGIFPKRCIRYRINENKPKQWQFLDMPYYTYGQSRHTL